MRSARQHPYSNLRESSAAGFSLLEMLVCLVITAIMASMALPELFALQANAVQDEAVTMFETDMSRMRSEALSAGVRAVVNVGSTGTTYAAGLDLLPYGASPALDQSVLSSRLPTNVTLTGTDQIIFDSRGFSVDSLGQSAVHTVTFNIRGRSFCVATVSVTGGVDFSCRK